MFFTFVLFHDINCLQIPSEYPKGHRVRLCLYGTRKHVVTMTKTRKYEDDDDNKHRAFVVVPSRLRRRNLVSSSSRFSLSYLRVFVVVSSSSTFVSSLSYLRVLIVVPRISLL